MKGITQYYNLDMYKNSQWLMAKKVVKENIQGDINIFDGAVKKFIEEIRSVEGDPCTLGLLQHAVPKLNARENVMSILEKIGEIVLVKRIKLAEKRIQCTSPVHHHEAVLGFKCLS